MEDRPIGMFDSGVGGLTVYKEIKQKLPNERIIYLGDTKEFPYGSKSKQSIIDLSKKNIEYLLQFNAKAIIIACGTATSQALDYVENMYNIPIIGIIEPTVNYIMKNKTYKDIGIIATRGTIRSNTWEKELKSRIHNINIYSKECPLLAPMAEEGWTQNEIATLTIKEYLKDLPKLDALILGCTHYPLFESTIKKELGNVDIINTGKIIAKYLCEYLYYDKNETKENSRNKTDEIYLTDTECNFVKVANNILESKVKIKHIII